MKRSMKFFALLCALLAFAAFAPMAQAYDAGAKIPNFTLQDMNGKKVSLADYKGRIVILNFWATWCPPCRAELPEFNEMNNELLKSKEAVLLAINMTDGMRDTKEKVASFLKENKYGIRVLLDSGKVADMFSIRGIPTTAVIDGKGVLRGQIVGSTTKANVMKLVKEAKK